MNGGADKRVNRQGGQSNDDLDAAREKLARAKQELQDAENAWNEDDFIEALKKKPLDEREKAVRLKEEIGTKLLMIENAQIELVVARVKENSTELESAISELGDSLQALSNITRILNAIGSLLSLVGRILAL